MDADAYLAALRYEREGYVRSGHPDRVRDVDAEIARVTGVSVQTAVDDGDVETATVPPPSRRRLR